MMAALKCQILSPLLYSAFLTLLRRDLCSCRSPHTKDGIQICHLMVLLLRLLLNSVASPRLQNVIAVWKTDPSHQQQQQQSGQSGWFGELGHWSRQRERPPTYPPTLIQTVIGDVMVLETVKWAKSDVYLSQTMWKQQQSGQSGWSGELGHWSRHGERPPTHPASSRLW